MNEIQYISYEEALVVYQKTIEKSGGGFSGIRDKGGIESVLDFVQNDLYYPDFVSKLSYLVFRFCSGHFFNDGNKRIALTLGTYFLHKNGHFWAAAQFMQRMEAIVYHIAASNIDDELLLRIMACVVDCQDFDEGLKIDIMNAMQKSEIVDFTDTYPELKL
ncbi:MAG: Fic family protein [Tannerellaceae bacterium]|jgi:death-on-curing protein|nr:Fic family protein [Tannerellaceae bacterium]